MSEGAARCTTRLLFVRHGESNATVERRLAGMGSCTGLSPLGRQQSERLGERLVVGGERPVDRLVSSTVPRARQTAELVGRWLGREVEVDSAWEEHRPGPADGLRFDEVIARYGRPDRHGRDDEPWWPGAETLVAFRARVVAALAALIDASAGLTSLVACHGGVIDVVFRHLVGLPSASDIDLWTLNTSITEFAADHPFGAAPDRWRLVRYNDAAHLSGLPAQTPHQPLP